jgi:hypothetical protein
MNSGGRQAETSLKSLFTADTGRADNGADEENGFILHREPLAYHPKT